MHRALKMSWLIIASVCATAAGEQHMELAVRQYVDVIERNYYYGGTDINDLTFEQMIFWEWNKFDERFNVLAWRMSDEFEIVRYDWDKRLWRLSFYDTKCHCWRVVYSLSYRETKTTYDPEVEDRKWLSQEYRRGLLVRN